MTTTLPHHRKGAGLYNENLPARAVGFHKLQHKQRKPTCEGSFLARSTVRFLISIEIYPKSNMVCSLFAQGTPCSPNLLRSKPKLICPRLPVCPRWIDGPCLELVVLIRSCSALFFAQPFGHFVQRMGGLGANETGGVKKR